MMLDKELRKTVSGNVDSTAGDALQNVKREMDAEDERFMKLLKIIWAICELSGFRMVGRITVVDSISGRVFK